MASPDGRTPADTRGREVLPGPAEVAKASAGSAASRIRAWLLEDLTDQAVQHPGPHRKHPPEHKQHSWWKVMCLTGVDYFSTLGYQPGIAALAAGAVSPLATLVLVLLTLCGALPVYRQVAAQSPHGEGSIAMLERTLPKWAGKLFVLVLLGFAATDFLITMTLSAADATTHAAQNALAPGVIRAHPVLITLILLALLGAVFLIGFTEAIGVAVGIVGTYLLLNLVVIASALAHIAAHPAALHNWRHLLTSDYSSPLAMIAVALVVFPRLALGLSGFETGVAVMPQIRTDPGDTEDHPAGRIHGTRKLLTAAATIMTILLLTGSFAATVLIPADDFRPGGAANGRAIAYLAHTELGSAVGTAYDLSTIAILWFAGASAMAGLLNLVPRYLPRYGMAPRWARATRPLVFVFTAVAFLVTAIFHASVDAQGGAYATGVLFVITSAAVAVALSMHRRRQRRATVAFALVAGIFIYTTIVNIIERPEGIKIASCFIGAILIVSFASRAVRSFELRAGVVEFDAVALQIINAIDRTTSVIANEPDQRDRREYAEKEAFTRALAHLSADEPVIFLEVTVTDPSDFESDLCIRGEYRFGYRVLRVSSSNVANTIAAVLLAIRDRTRTIPHVYFNWTEGDPIRNVLRFLFLGEGEVAAVTREVLREAEPDPQRRPVVHVA